jgi:hypothetical protein
MFLLSLSVSVIGGISFSSSNKPASLLPAIKLFNIFGVVNNARQTLDFEYGNGLGISAVLKS